jgi:hypothetical protein
LLFNFTRAKATPAIIQFYWQPKQTHGQSDFFEQKGQTEVAGYDLSANDLETLTSFELLEMRYHLARIASMSAANES